MINGKIIVVDDNEAVLKTLRVILSREFKTVVCVSVPTLFFLFFPCITRLSETAER